MSLFSNIFDNPGIKNAAFGQLKKLIKSENLGLIIVRLNAETDELEIDMYKPGEALITVIHPDDLPIGEAALEGPKLLTEKPVENANDQNS